METVDRQFHPGPPLFRRFVVVTQRSTGRKHAVGTLIMIKSPNNRASWLLKNSTVDVIDDGEITQASLAAFLAAARFNVRAYDFAF